MKYIWLILPGLMILGFAGASLFSSNLLVPAKPGAAELILPKTSSPEKQPELATVGTPVPHQKQNPAFREQKYKARDVTIDRSRKYEPLVVRRIPVNETIRRRAESEALQSGEQARPSRSDHPVNVTDPYDPNCNPDREICAGVKSKSRPRRVEPLPTDASGNPQPKEQKGNGVLNAIKKAIPGRN
jgi:hypothetical protein